MIKGRPAAAPAAMAPTARDWLSRRGLSVARLGLLDRTWESLYGHKKRLWTLEGVQRGVLFVRASSSAAKHDLLMRTPQIVRELNKHFDSPWVKGIKAVQG